MKKGYKALTGVFGNDAEAYAASLFHMMRNPNGTRRPDLISLNGTYSPRLSIEVKSGKGKGVLVDYQLHYGITSGQDYEEVLGEKLMPSQPQLDFAGTAHGPVAYYYDLVTRPPGLSSHDMRKPFASIQLVWSNQYLIPHKLGFFMFAVERSRRTGETLAESVEYVAELMKHDFISESSNYYRRKQDKNSWQDLHARDIYALIRGNPKVATVEGQERLKALEQVYPEVKNLRPLVFSGPNSTAIYVLAEPSHMPLFERNLSKMLEERVPIVERITKARKRACSLLDKMEDIVRPQSLFSNGGAKNLPEDNHTPIYSDNALTSEERARLNRLANWLDRDENPLGVGDNIPF